MSAELNVLLKSCTKCRALKPLSEFYRNRNRGDGYQNYCKVCHRAYAQAHYAGPYRDRALGLMKARQQSGKHYAGKFGITVERYWELINAGCQICGAMKSSDGKRLAIDHDHACCPGGRSCGKCVRGALCKTCNTGIALFGESVEKLTAAAVYLKGVCSRA